MDEVIFLGQLRTKIMIQERNGDTGFYELNVDLDMTEFKAAPDRKGYIHHMLARSLTEQIFLTGVPAEMWYFEYDDEFVRMTGWHKRLNFDGSAL